MSPSSPHSFSSAQRPTAVPEMGEGTDSFDSPAPSAPAHQIIQPAILYVGTPVVLLTTKNPDGTTNVSPMSSAWFLGDRCVLGLAVGSQSTTNLLREKECVLNLPNDQAAPFINRLHRTTGAEDVPPAKQGLGYRFVKDKMALLGFTPIPSDVVAPPRLNECPVAMEAKVVETHQMMQDSVGFAEFIMSFELCVAKVFVHPDIVMEGHANRIDPDKWRPLIMSFQHFYGLSERVDESKLAEIEEEKYRVKPLFEV